MALLDNVWYIDSAGAAPVTIGNLTNSTGATLTVTGTAVPAGATIVAVAFEATATASGTFSDGTNTYTTLTSGAAPSTGGFATVFVSQSVAALTTSAVFTFTRQTSGHAASINIFYITNVGAVDTSVTANATTTTTALTIASGVPSVAGDILIAAVCSATIQNSLGQPTGFTTTIFGTGTGSSANVGTTIACLGTAAYSYTPTSLNAANTIGFLFAFKPGTPAGWNTVSAWSASATKVCGNIIRNSTPMAYGNERCFVCYNSTGGVGTTGATEPVWTFTRGVLVTDNTVKWQEITGVAALNGDLTNTPNWTAYKTFTATATLGQVIKSGDGTKILSCTVGGNMGSSEPTWAAYTTTGATTIDGSATWVTIAAVPSGFSNWSAPHARIEAAFTSNWGQKGNNFYVASEHIQHRLVSNLTLTSPGVAGSVCKVASVSKSTVPPTSVTAGATIQSSGTNASTAQVTLAGGGLEWVYYNGFVVNVGYGVAAVQNLTLCGGSGAYSTLENSALNVVSTGNSSRITTTSNGGRLDCIDCTLSWLSSSGGIQAGSASGIANFIGGSIAATGNSATDLFLSASPTSLVGVDLSNFVGNIAGNNSVLSLVKIQDCKLNSAVTMIDFGAAVPPYEFVDVIRSDSSGTNYRVERNTTFGKHVIETTIVRAGGAQSANAVPVSWNVSTTANASFTTPFQSLLMAIQNSVIGANRTITLYGTCKLSALPNNDQIWISGDYLGSAASPIGTLFNDTKANFLTTASAQSADTSAWGASAPAYQTAHVYGAFTGVILAGNANPQQLWFMASHSGTGTSGSNPAIFNGQVDGAQVTDNAGANQIVWQAIMRFKMSFTMSSPQPAQQGQINVRANVGLASANFYVDPQPELS